jgi:hypothetical protein
MTMTVCFDGTNLQSSITVGVSGAIETV